MLGLCYCVCSAERRGDGGECGRGGAFPLAYLPPELLAGILRRASVRSRVEAEKTSAYVARVSRYHGWTKRRCLAVTFDHELPLPFATSTHYVGFKSPTGDARLLGARKKKRKGRVTVLLNQMLVVKSSHASRNFPNYSPKQAKKLEQVIGWTLKRVPSIDAVEISCPWWLVVTEPPLAKPVAQLVKLICLILHKFERQSISRLTLRNCEIEQGMEPIYETTRANATSKRTLSVFMKSGEARTKVSWESHFGVVEVLCDCS